MAEESHPQSLRSRKWMVYALIVGGIIGVGFALWDRNPPPNNATVAPFAQPPIDTPAPLPTGEVATLPSDEGAGEEERDAATPVPALEVERPPERNVARRRLRERQRSQTQTQGGMMRDEATGTMRLRDLVDLPHNFERR